MGALAQHLAPLEAHDSRPIVIGIYGVPGAGKSFLLSRLETVLNNGSERFSFYEGTQVILQIVSGTLEAFQKLPEADKTLYRQQAIIKIRDSVAASGHPAIVTGHWMFWPEGEAGQYVYTQHDLAVYTHIVYLDTPADIIIQRRQGDLTRAREPVSREHIRAWQCEEKTQIRRVCHKHGILFSTVGTARPSETETEVLSLIRGFIKQTEESNTRLAKEVLDDGLQRGTEDLETVLVLDGDKTLIAEDTGTLFWKAIAQNRESSEEAEDPLQTLFSGPLGYSFLAFCQANLLYEEANHNLDFQKTCDAVAAQVSPHAEFLRLLEKVETSHHTRAVVVTCGLAVVWDKILRRAGLTRCTVVGGGPNGDRTLVVTAQVKAALVDHIQHVLHCHVLAFGDSTLDIPMLSKADEAFIVVGNEQTRSRSMEAALLGAIDSGGLHARQVLLPHNVPPRLDLHRLPAVDITDPAFAETVFRSRTPRPGSRVLHSSDKNAAKLLMTPTRDAAVAGPALREAHRRVGWYLATTFLGDLLGVEEHLIPHVQGHHTSGYRLASENQTLIVAVMRAGEPMAFGVSDVFPLALFVHAKRPEDISQHLARGDPLRVVILVDAVINSGKTALEFVQLIRRSDPDLRIVLVAGVTQAKAVTGNGGLAQAVAQDSCLHLVTLRLSSNKYTGSGTTDTGNRLFNTTHLS
ncbi:hypothetical protein M406DRAFT_349858 [Cryphonectria parasitica EP155]|uniref:Phosphoribosyltransferase domain-containing protein n=1 Tax=Cryphonectria parasitica (strain ATCC 38755 / EP155) TaxID=660469 RepID=A0A9P4Y9C5_CRYP1|nr:uncharacterized protein M406DRAFT_349858 [Cryphonectria parasitica EP155]KAF3768732.1 hypothetical protein M406DRAFT_349858 [Cryphonectria parasitica EP155]